MEQAEANGIWKSVAWWYQNLAQFTLDWELVHLSDKEKASTFPLMKPLLEGNIPVQPSTTRTCWSSATPSGASRR